MFGSGQGIFKTLLPISEEYKSYRNPLFEGISPEPIPKNLTQFSAYLKAENRFDVAFVVDGDADRIGMMDGQGNYINSHEIMLILLWILVKYKNQTGPVATGFSSTDKIRILCEKYNLPLTIVPIGFKHISKLMIDQPILMGGEESGGIAVSGHIPERDGIFNSFLILEFLAKQNISINQLLNEIEAELGAFAYNRLDLKITEEQKSKVLKTLSSNSITEIADKKVQNLETLDGYKFRLSNSEWVMARLSGTEPLLRIYAEAETPELVESYIEGLKEILI
jgi:phosphomannomutase